MLVISSRKLAHEKVNRIKNGFSAFTETEEVAQLIKKELESLEVTVHIDATDKGYWFIPIIQKTTA